MKKTALAAAIVMALGLFSCGTDTENSSDKKKDKDKTQSASQSEEETTSAGVSGGEVISADFESKPTEAPTEEETEAPTVAKPVSQGIELIKTDRGILSEEAAFAKVRDYINAEYGVKFIVESTERIPERSDEPNSPEHDVYIVHAYSDQESHYATVGWYAVAMDEDIIWEYDIVADEYEFIPNGSPLVDWTYGIGNSAAGLIVRYPDEYYQWALDPDYEYDASGGDMYAETILVCAIYDDTTVTLYDGKVSMDDFSFSGDAIGSFTLAKGQYVKIKCSVPESFPTFAVEFSSAAGKGMSTVAYSGKGDPNVLEYVDME